MATEVQAGRSDHGRRDQGPRMLLVREEIVNALAELHGHATAVQTFMRLEAAARTVSAKPRADDTSVKDHPACMESRSGRLLRWLALLFGGGGGRAR